jgi:hypothetical protein
MLVTCVSISPLFTQTALRKLIELILAENKLELYGPGFSSLAVQ